MRAIREHTEENLRRLQGAPSVQMQEIPESFLPPEQPNDGDADADVRFPQSDRDKAKESVHDLWGDD